MEISLIGTLLSFVCCLQLGSPTWL